MKNTIALIFAASVLSVSDSLAATVLATLPFNTTVRNYAYVGKTGLNATTSRIALYLSQNPAALNGGFDTGRTIVFMNDTAQDLNAAGISRRDGFLYAMEYLYNGPASSYGRLYRVGSNAVAASIGIVPGPTSTDAGRTIQYSFVNLASGMVDSAGNYWFNAYTITNLTSPYSVTKVDMFLGKISGLNLLSTATSTTTLTPTYYKLDISDTLIQTGITNLLTQQAAMVAYSLPITNADGGWQDMDIKLSNGEFYSYASFPSAPSTVGNNPYPKPALNSYLVHIDHTTSPWKVRVVNTIANTNPNREEDGAYFDGAGNFYVLFTDGQYSKVNLVTGTLDSLNQSTLPLFSGNLRGDLATNMPTSLTPINPLPVNLVSFSGRRTNSLNEIRWQSAVETELSNYELQRSDDGRSFLPIGNFSSGGSNSSYGYTDLQVGGTQFYRLRLVFEDGSSEYSAVLKLGGSVSGGSTSLYPTVVTNGRLHLTASSANIKVSIHNANGELVQSTSYNGIDGMNCYDMNVTLPTGMYFVDIVDQRSAVRLLSSTIIIP